MAIAADLGGSLSVLPLLRCDCSFESVFSLDLGHCAKV